MNTSHARHNRKLRLLRRVASALTPMGLIGIAAAACQNPETPTAAQYAEYTCPQPIGVILRDDCARTSSKFDTLQSRGAVIAGTPEFRAAVLREVDATAVGLKAQAETQCNNFNTCRLPREDYMQAQGRLDSAFTELLNIRASISSLDAAGSVVVTQQIRDMRNAKSAAPVVTPARAAPDIAVQPVVATAPRAVTATSTPSTTASEWRPGKFMIQAVAGVADAANKLGTDSSWGYDVDGSAIMGAYLKTGASISMISNYEAGREYALLGQGSEGTIDLDMAIKNVSTGQTIKADVDTDASPVVHFFVPRTGQYEVVIQLQSARSSGEFVAIASMHKGGYGVPAANVIASLSRAVSACTRANAQAGPLSFHESGNWSLQATILKPHESANYRNILLESGSTIFLATGDDFADDIDLQVTNTTTNQRSADTDNDATPVVNVPSNRASHRHDVKLSNAASRGPSFITMMLLDKAN